MLTWHAKMQMIAITVLFDFLEEQESSSSGTSRRYETLSGRAREGSKPFLGEEERTSRTVGWSAATTSRTDTFARYLLVSPSLRLTLSLVLV